MPVVIDHMARIDASLGLDRKRFRGLLRLMEDRKFWVKVSGWERASWQAAPWKDAIPFARIAPTEAQREALLVDNP